MTQQFTASEVRTESCKQGQLHRQPASDMLNAFADMLEARERAVPVAWSLIFEESIGVNAPTTYNRREDAEDYADACAMPDKCNPFPHRPKVVPLYTHPTPADADRLAEQRDDAFQQAVQEARRVWMDEFPCEAGHDHVTPFDQFLYGNRPCMEAQPPAARVPDEYQEIARLIGSIFCAGEFKAETWNERELERLLKKTGNWFDNVDQVPKPFLAAQENPNG